MREVTVYRLWPDGHWDTVRVQIDTRPPLTFNSVEERAAKAAWYDVGRAGVGVPDKPRQIGLYMPDYPSDLPH